MPTRQHNQRRSPLSIDLDWLYLFGRFREDHACLPELDRSHASQRRVNPEVVVPMHVVGQLGLQLASRAERLAVNELRLQDLVRRFVDRVFVGASLSWRATARARCRRLRASRRSWRYRIRCRDQYGKPGCRKGGTRPSQTRPSPGRRPCAVPPNARRSRGSPGRPAGRRGSSRRRRARRRGRRTRGRAARARRTAWPPHWAGRLRWTCRDGIWASCARTRRPSRFPSLSCRFACGWPLCRGGQARPLSCARRAARGSPRARPARRARWGSAASGIPRASASSSRSSAQRRASRIAPIPGSGRRSPPSPSLSCEYQRRLF